MFKQLAQAISRRRSIDTLATLDPRILRDIGIEPGQIRRPTNPLLFAYNTTFDR